MYSLKYKYLYSFNLLFNLRQPTQTGGAFEFLEWASIETMFQVGGGGGANLLFSELSTIFCSLTNEEIKLTVCHFFY